MAGDSIDALPPLSEATREAFDKAALSMYRDDCKCVAFLLEGVAKKLPWPLSERNRHMLMIGMEYGFVIPLPAEGEQGT